MTHPATLALLAADVPVDPNAEQARAWLEAELVDPIYHDQPSLLERLIAWFMEQLDLAGRAISTLNVGVAAIVTLAVILVIVAIGLLVAGPIRRTRRTARPSADVLGDDLRTAAELRAAADAHAAAGRFGPAVLDRFRAILRSLEERAILDPRPGRTADEAAMLAGDRLPALAGDLSRAGRLFDDVCYGDAEADAVAAGWMRDLDTAVARARPVSAQAVGVG